MDTPTVVVRYFAAARAAAGTDADAGGGLFGTQTIPVTLVGTSYSADERWNFTGALQTALGADVLNLATEGRGPLPPMRELPPTTTLAAFSACTVI